MRFICNTTAKKSPVLKGLTLKCLFGAGVFCAFLAGCDDDDDAKPEDAAPLPAEDAPAKPPQDAEVTEDATEEDAEPQDAAPGECPTTDPWITVNQIPASMNGSAPFLNQKGEQEAFTLLLPTGGFTLEVMGDPKHLYKLSSMGCGSRDSHAEATEIAEGYQLAIAENAFSAGKLTCSALLRDPCTSERKKLSLEIQVQERTPEIDPFEEIDRWLIVTSRDAWTLNLGTKADGTPDFTTEEAPNGLPDLDEALLAVGFASPAAYDPESQNALAKTQSARFKAELLKQTMTELRALFLQPEDGRLTNDSVRVQFYIEGDADAPKAEDFESQDFSMIALGGGSLTDSALGRAALDWNNQQKDDNVTLPARGVFTNSLAALFLTHSAGKMVFSSFAPALGGTPIGEAEGDEALFEPTSAVGFTTRASTVQSALPLLARGIAALTAHEIGHSLGLVPYGAPPYGLFAGENNAAFIEAPSTGAHIDTAGYNVMQQGSALSGSGMELLTAKPAFNALNRAYLQRRLLVLPQSSQP